uniref:Uncharacterized protein n=1 Tax=Fervidobacterium nodosum TaxID=2424 RepID=A0A7C5Y6Y8_9BACT
MRYLKVLLTAVLVLGLIFAVSSCTKSVQAPEQKDSGSDELVKEFYSSEFLSEEIALKLLKDEIDSKEGVLVFGKDEISNEPSANNNVVLVVSEQSKIFDPDLKKGTAYYYVSALKNSKELTRKFVRVAIDYTPDGWKVNVIDVENYKIPEEEIAIEKNLEASPLANGYPDPFYRLITPGVSGNDVRFLQERLNEFLIEKGYNVQLTVDGIYGPKTQSAVLNYCQYYGLNYDGNFGYNKMVKLLSVTDGKLDVIPSMSIEKIEYITSPLVVGETEVLRVTIARNSYTNLNYEFYIVAESSAHGQLASALVNMSAGEQRRSFNLVVKFNKAGDFKTTIKLFTKNLESITARTGTYPDTVKSSSTPSFTPRVSIDSIDYTTKPLVVDEAENLKVVISESGGTNISRSLKIVVSSSAHGQLGETTVTWNAGEVTKSVNFPVKFRKAGEFSTKVSVYTQSGSLVAERMGLSKDTVYASNPSRGPSIPSWARFYIYVDLWKDRSREGKLYLYDRSGNLRYTTRALGMSALGRPWYQNSGDTPTGGYEGTLAAPAYPAESFGIGNVVELWGISGNAYRAYYEFGRAGIWIHGGRGIYTGYSGAYLYPTHGCVRIPDDAQVAMFGKGYSNLGIMGQIGVYMGSKGYVVVDEK